MTTAGAMDGTRSAVLKAYAEADPRQLADWQIAEIAEPGMPTPDEWRERLGLERDEIIPMGKTINAATAIVS